MNDFIKAVDDTANTGKKIGLQSCTFGTNTAYVYGFELWGGQKGATNTSAPITHTAEGADHEALDVQLYHSGSAISPLTDTQLRATAVPVSGTVTATIAGGTNAASNGGFAVSGQLPAALGGAGGLKAEVVAALPAGTNNIGDVDVLTLPALPAGTNNIGDVDVLTVPADPFGANADAIVAAGAVGSISAKLRRATQGLEDLKTGIVLGAGGNSIGNIGNAFALDATLTGGTTKAINRGGAKGATTAADVTSTAEGADHQALDVQLYHGGAAIDPTQIRALTATDKVTLAPGTNSIGTIQDTTSNLLWATAVGTAGAAVTLTVPASGTAGIFQYIGFLEITLFSTAARTGTSNIVTVTTTNWPGLGAFTFPSAGAVGAVDRYFLSPAAPIRAASANVNLTIVCPGTASVAWRVNCGYRTGT